MDIRDIFLYKIIDRGSRYFIINNMQTTENIIKKSKLLHGDMFSYDKTIYINATSKVEFYCNKHKIYFKQYLCAHFRSKTSTGCKLCIKEKFIKAVSKTTDDFIKRSIAIHDTKYNYDKTNYINNKTKVIIFCNKCKQHFKQAPNHHLRGNNCPCYKKITQEEFIERANKIHNNKYIYDYVKYINSNTKIKILCKEHGFFMMLPNNHLSGKNKCPQCTSYISNNETKWLNEQNIPKENRNKFLTLDNIKINVDGLDPLNKIVWEMYGCYHHGDPRFFAPKDINKRRNCTFQELYEKTLFREQLLLKYNYKIISIWESDYDEKMKRQLMNTTKYKKAKENNLLQNNIETSKINFKNYNSI